VESIQIQKYKRTFRSIAQEKDGLIDMNLMFLDLPRKTLCRYMHVFMQKQFYWHQGMADKCVGAYLTSCVNSLTGSRLKMQYCVHVHVCRCKSKFVYL